MTDLGPLAERLRNVEDHTETIEKNGLMKFGEGLDGRVLEKVIVALEARLTEHVGHVDRRLAEIDAQVALDLKAVDTHTAAQQSGAEQISGVDQRLSALQEALPAKFREIIEAVRQSMEARVALELTELENRVGSRGVTPEHVQEIQSNLRAEVEALSGRLSAEMRGLAEHQQSQAAPLQQALEQLETKLTTLREELPPKIRQIVEAVEASMDARISAGDQQAADRAGTLEQGLAALRAEMPSAGGLQQAVDESLRRHAEQVGALDQKLTVLQEELPPKIKAIVDAVRESLDARMAVELQSIEERHNAQIQQAEARVTEAQEQFRRQLAAESTAPELEQNLAKLQADLAATDARLQASVADRLASVSAELDSLQARHRAEVEQLEARWRAERAAENVPAQIESAVAGLRQSLEAKLAAEIHDLEARTPDGSPDLEKALQYASLLEARVQSLEQKLQRSAEETVDRAVERVWQALESRLQQREAQAPPVVVQSPETITGLRQKSTSAEQSVLDLIAGIGQLFEKPAPRVVRETPPPSPRYEPPAAQIPAAPEPVASVHVEPEPVAPVYVEPEPVTPVHAAPEPVVEAHVEAEPVAEAYTPPAPEPEPEAKAEAQAEPEPEPEAHVIAAPQPAAKAPEPAMEPVAAAPIAAAVAVEEQPEDKPPVILFKPKESGRKWRIPFVSSFLLMAVAIAWLQFT